MTDTRVVRFFTGTMILTVILLLYVHQSIEMVKLGYAINEKQKILSSYIDQHRRLVYCLNKLESPIVLNERLCAKHMALVETDIRDIRYASMKYKNDKVRGSAPRASVIDRFLDTFTVKAEAKPRK
jgi:hypothetical protein